MANTFTADTTAGKTVFGNVRVVFGVATMTDGGASTVAIPTINRIVHATMSPKSASTSMDKTTFLTAAYQIESAVSGDTFFLTVYGV